MLSFCKHISLVYLTSERELIYDKTLFLLAPKNKVCAPIYFAHIRH